ncbi:MAG TPA: hypothetical protein ENK28_02710 [Aliiroseovarius sp.]|nr:hypothetical protein [Aliiroseovarius sp.]
MKASDKDLIEKLNGLSDKDKADLLEFLGTAAKTDHEKDHMADLLEASIYFNRKSESGPRRS